MGKGYIDFILHDNEDTIVKAPSQLFKLANSQNGLTIHLLSS